MDISLPQGRKWLRSLSTYDQEQYLLQLRQFSKHFNNHSMKEKTMLYVIQLLGNSLAHGRDINYFLRRNGTTTNNILVHNPLIRITCGLYEAVFFSTVEDSHIVSSTY